MRSEFISYFFLPPQMRPLAISCLIRGWSVAEAHEAGCCATYWSRARITAELLTVQPRASEASWLSCWRSRSVSRLSVWVRGRRGSFFGVGLGRAIQRDHISPAHGMLHDREH